MAKKTTMKETVEVDLNGGMKTLLAGETYLNLPKEITDQLPKSSTKTAKS